MLIALPSFTLLFSLDPRQTQPYVNLKVIGSQWYWSYEYQVGSLIPNSSLKFDGYMIPSEDQNLPEGKAFKTLSGAFQEEYVSEIKQAVTSKLKGYISTGEESGAIDTGNTVQESDVPLHKRFRLLSTHLDVRLPVEVDIRILITATDVLHSWAVPSLGIKLDACPGRLNEVFVHILRQGYFYGQCSEICGVNHAFMPIMVNAVSYIKYTDWLAVRYFENIDSILDLWWRRWFFRYIVRS